MKVLALHSLGHDAGVSYFEDGKLVVTVEAERLTRVKHDHRVESALQYVLSRPTVDADGIDLIAVSTPVHENVLRIPDIDRAKEAVNRGASHYRTTSSLLGRPVDCVVVTHEVSHAALAAHYAGHRAGCVVLVNEGRGQITSSSLFRVENGKLRWLEKDPLPWYSNGFGWSAMAHLFGFGRDPSVVGKVMAVGGYGQPSARVREILQAVDPGVISDPALAEATWRDLAGRPEISGGFQTMADVVATFQQMFTESVQDLLVRYTGVPAGVDVALGGGCALNIVANAHLRQRLGRDITIPPACGDAGHPVGAGVYALKYLYGVDVASFSVYSNGVAEPTGTVVETLSAAGLSPFPYDRAQVARELARGRVVAFAEGAGELGPRALGHRSLLGDPSVPGMRKRISEELKQREWFRPLGAVIRQERFAEEFPGQPPSPYMLFNYDVPEGPLAEARHVDGTSRLQTLEHDACLRLHELLAEFERHSEAPALINTSLNGPGRSIAQSTVDMLDDFAGRGVDLFVCGDVMAYNHDRRPADRP